MLFRNVNCDGCGLDGDFERSNLNIIEGHLDVGVQQHWFNCDSVCLLQSDFALTSMAFPVLNNVGDYFYIYVTTEGKAKGMRKDEQASVVVHAKNTRMAGRWGAGGDRGDR